MRVDGKIYGIGRVVDRRRISGSNLEIYFFELDFGDQTRKYSFRGRSNYFVEGKPYVFERGNNFSCMYIKDTSIRDAVIQEFNRIKAIEEKPKGLIGLLKKIFY